jgi:hypothetical protein
MAWLDAGRPEPEGVLALAANSAIDGFLGALTVD